MLTPTLVSINVMRTHASGASMGNFIAESNQAYDWQAKSCWRVAHFMISLIAGRKIGKSQFRLI